MKSLSETVLGRALGLLADAVMRHRWLFLWPQIILFVLCVLYTIFNLKFDTSRDNLVGSDKKYHQNFLQYKKEFPAQDDLVVVAESENPEKNRQFVERLGAKLEVETNLFTDVLYRNDFKMLGQKALLFASEDDLKGLRQKLNDYMPFIQRFTQATNLDSLFGMVNSQFLHAKREANTENDALIKAVPVLDGIVRQAAESIQRQGTPPSPGIAALFGAGDDDIYITFDKLRMYIVTAQARREDLNGPALERLRVLVEMTEKEVPGVNIGITGEPVLENDEMEQSKRDSIVASILSLVLCACLFIYGYQGTGRPLKATFCLLIGLGYTMAFTTLVVGHLNILTITFLPILIGLAIDFGIHLITRYEEELRLGRSGEEAIWKAIVFTGQGIFTGALTTAAAFLAMALTNFKGIQEMGIICGGGMLICLVPMLTLLPVLLLRGRQNLIDHQPQNKVRMRVRIENIWLSRPITVSVVTVILSTLAVTQFSKIFFDYNLLNMQSKELPAVIFEGKLLHPSTDTNGTAKSVLFGAVIADSAEKAVELEQQLRRLPAVSEVDSMAPRVMGDQSKKLQLISQIKQEIAPIHFAPDDKSSVQLFRLSATLYSTSGYMGAAATEVDAEEPAVFSSADIVGLESLAAKLKKPGKADEVSQYLSSRLSPATQSLLSADSGLAPQLEEALVGDLNRIFLSGPIYERERFAKVKLSPETLTLLGQDPGGTNLVRLNRALLFDAYPQELSALSRQLIGLRNSINDLRKQMFAGDPNVVSHKLAAFQQALFNDIHDTFQSFQNQDDSAPLRVDDLPPALHHRFIGQTGKYLLQVYPKKDVWQRANQEEFVKELQTIVPNATGTPVQLYYYTELLRTSYEQAAWYSLYAIIIMVLLHFRSLFSVILALLPVGIGSIWLGGLMGLFHVPFNPANIMTLPLVIGIGVTNGIHILNRFAEERAPGILSKSTGKAVFVSGLATISGFGSLIMAQHQGIRSLGEVMSMGVALCMIAALTFLPAVLNLVPGWMGIKKNNPVATMHDRHWVGRNRGKNLK